MKHKFLLKLMLILVVLNIPGSVMASLKDDKKAVLYDYPFYEDSNSSALCSVAGTSLPADAVAAINANMPTYQQASDQTNVPWQLFAAIHYRETALRIYNPDNGQGVYQFTSGGFPPASTISQAEFLRQSIAAGNAIQNDYVKRSPIAGHNKPLTKTGNDPEEIKDLLFSYNGRAGVYAQQAAALGFSPTTQPYEGSPYVMNNFDKVHMNMQIITTDGGGLSARDTRLGAFTVFSLLAGASGCNGSGSLPIGDSRQLAQQIIDNPNIDKLSCALADLQATASDGTTISNNLLRVLLGAAQAGFKIQIYVIRSCHGGVNLHSLGRAADISKVGNTPLGSGFDDPIPSPDYTNFLQWLAKSAPAGASGNSGSDTGRGEVGVPNDQFKAVLDKVSLPPGYIDFLDRPETTGATGPHFHVGVPQ